MDDKKLLKTFDYQPLSLKAPSIKKKVKTVIIRMCLRRESGETPHIMKGKTFNLWAGHRQQANREWDE